MKNKQTAAATPMVMPVGVLLGLGISLILLLGVGVVAGFASHFSQFDLRIGWGTDLVTYLAIAIGSLVAGRKIKAKGWLVGLAVSLASLVVFKVLAGLFGVQTALIWQKLVGVILAGALGGMLGVAL